MSSVQRQLEGANSEQELKEKIFIFLCVEVQRHFQQLRDSDPGVCVAERAPSQRVEELAKEMASELESHLQLCQELAKTKEDAQVHQLCEEELAELAQLQEEDNGEDGYEAKRRVAVEFQDEEAALEELRTLAGAEETEVARLRALVDFEEQLGLPRIEIHGEVLTLGTGSEDPLCSLEVKWDDAGHLLLAQPHPSLRLDHEATKAVEEDDLGRLLVLVWDRASNQGSKPAE